MRQGQTWTTKSLLATALIISTTESSAAVIEEVVVTAQKREQSTQDVGIAISAFTGDQIKELGFTQTTDVVAMTPGVQYNQTTGDSGYSFSIRGVNQSDFADHQESPVAVYVDEVYISQNPATGFAMFDIDRVEVLRGPQGTLFGRNATGGLLHFITKRPSEEFEAYLDVGLGSEQSRRYEGAVGAPLTDGIRARLSGLWEENAAWIKNNSGKDGGEKETWALRAQLAFDLGDSGNLLLNAHGGRFETPTPFYWQWDGNVMPGSDGLPINAPVGPDNFGYQDRDGDPFEGAWDAKGGYFTEHKGLTATLTWEFENFNFVSVTNAQTMDKEFIGDTDGGPDRSSTNNIPAFDPLTMTATGSGGVGQMHYGNDTEADQWSQELRIDGSWDEGRWMVGAYYLEIDGRYEQYVGFSPDTPYMIGGNPIADQETKTWALFGQTELDLSETLTLIVGARYTDDDKEVSFSNSVQAYLDGTNGDNRVTLVPNAATFEGAESDGLVTAKVELDWKPNEDNLIYLSWNRGVKGGGFNHPLPPVQYVDDFYTFDPEVLNAYELGIKSELGGIARFNGSVYYYDYTDYQAYQLIPGIAQNVFNQDAEMSGIDAELLLFPAEGWDIVLSAAYVDATVFDVQLSSGTVDREPTKIPALTGAALVRYSWDLLDGTAAIQLETNYQSEAFFDILNQPALEEEAYTLTNIRASYKVDDKWSVTAFVENVSDKEYRVSAFALDAPFMSMSRSANYGRPRWAGISFRYNWD
jgi:iron complex outermembrane receptor protein